jgi:hypothetical protein
VLFFLIFAVTAPYNAILPSVAVLAHLAAGRIRPCRSPHPNLDFLGAVSVVAMLWLFLGELSGVSTLNAYNLTFAGAALIFATLAASSGMLPGVAAAALVAIVVATMGWNAERTHGQSLPWPWIVASFVPCLLVPFAWPQFLDRHRGSRALALAVPVPLLAFAGMALWA